MAKKKRTISLLLDIVFTYDSERITLEEAEELAKDLALNPNFDTIVNGVSLSDIGVEEID